MKRTTLLLILLFGLQLFSIPEASCAGEEIIDVVVMKDGAVIKGTILQLNTREVTIETLEGEKVVKNFSDILTFRKEELAQAGPKEGVVAAGEKQGPFLDRHVWQVGPELYYVKYKEPGVMEETGMMAGIGGSYAYHNDLMLKGELRVAFGQVDYTSSGWGSMSNINDALLETRFLVGYDLVLPGSSAMTFYTGFGYRFLQDDSSGKVTTTGARGYKRRSNYLYSPIGMEAIASIADKWRVLFVVEYDYFWKGKQESFLSDADPNFGDLTNDQKRGYGLRSSLGFERAFDWGKLSFGPFVRYWDINESDLQNVTYAGAIVGIGWEPANNTLETGMVVNFSF